MSPKAKQVRSSAKKFVPLVQIQYVTAPNARSRLNRAVDIVLQASQSKTTIDSPGIRKASHDAVSVQGEISDAYDSKTRLHHQAKERTQ